MNKYSSHIGALIVSLFLAGCTSDEHEETINNSKRQPITFDASQESDANSSRTAISPTDKSIIIWQPNDQISIFDGSSNNVFTLEGNGGSSKGTFSGIANTADTYTAVYPYKEDMVLNSDRSVANVSLPATQTATANGFDPKAVLMIAETSNTTLQFKNAVSYIAVTPQFACTKIILSAVNELVPLAGTGTLKYNNGTPTIAFTSNKAYSIKLEGNITAGNTYYIVVPAVTLTAGWRISFTASNGNVYVRKATKNITFKRNTRINLGTFNITDNYWYNPRGSKVTAAQEVDLGLTITINRTSYKVIFTNGNLKVGGITTSQTEYGDYFAWAATTPWYGSISYTSTDPTYVKATAWKTGKSEGYITENSKYYDTSTRTFTKYTTNRQILQKTDDAASIILGGDWVTPPIEVWQTLDKSNSHTWKWGNHLPGVSIKNNTTGKTIILPAGGYFTHTENTSAGKSGGVNYWSSTPFCHIYNSKTVYNAYYLEVVNGTTQGQRTTYSGRGAGMTIRPVRLVEI